MIELRNITKRFGRYVALDGVTLVVPQGEIVALWGPNGAGKSTLVKCLLGLLRFRGTAHVAGIDVKRSGKRARHAIGYLPQEPGLFDDLRVVEVANLFAALKRVPKRYVVEMLRHVDLAGHGRKRVRHLSGGMKQRLSLGLALLADPPVLVLDEPTSNLDAVARRDLVDQIRRLKQAEKTVLLISHRPEDVKEIADRIVTLEAGRIVRDCRADETSAFGRGTSSAESIDAGFDSQSLRANCVRGPESFAVDVVEAAVKHSRNNGSNCGAQT